MVWWKIQSVLGRDSSQLGPGWPHIWCIYTERPRRQPPHEPEVLVQSCLRSSSHRVGPK
jgi:hypothetical protein